MFQRVFQRGVSEGRFRGAFQRGVSEGRLRGVFQTPGWLSGAILCNVPRRQSCQGFVFPEDKAAKGPAQRDSSLKIVAEDGLDILVGNSACSFSATVLGKPSFRGGFRGLFQRGVSEGCFRGVLQRGVSDPLA